MNHDEWKKNVTSVIGLIADRSFQERNWFPGGDFQSSPEELICELFDDLRFDEFLRSSATYWTSEQRRLGEEFREKINGFSKSTGNFLDPKTVLTNPRWASASQAAKRFLDSFH